jgi:hypothetical protein
MRAWGVQDSSTDLRGPWVGGPVSGSLLFDLFVWIWALPGICVSTIVHQKLRLGQLKAFPKAHQTYV